MNLSTISKLLFFLIFISSFQSCSFIQQNDEIITDILSDDEGEKVFYTVFQTGIDNYRFEFKSAINSDTTLLYEYYLNDAVYKSMRITSKKLNDTLIIETNYPVNKIIRTTKTGTIVIIKNK